MSAGLRRSRLGVRRLVFFGIAAVTPLTVIVGGQSLGFGQLGQVGTAVGYLLAAAVLGVFAVGVAAMARHLPNPGAFYAYVAARLSRPLAVATAGIALVAYTAIQIGLFGLFGVAMVAALDAFGQSGWWAFWALMGWIAVAVLGQVRVRTNASVLAVLICAELGLVLVLDAVMVLHPADGIVRFDGLNPLLLANPTGIASLVGAITGLVGFEVPLAFAPLAVDPRTTVRRAIGWILLIVAVVYGGSAWAMTVVAGPDQIVGIAAQHPKDLFFHLAAPHVPAAVVTAGLVLFATSVFAAALAFHNTVSRYILTLSREGLLPVWLAITRSDDVPAAASLMQSTLAFLVLVAAGIGGVDPVKDLFFFGTTAGGLGVLIMMCLTGAAVIGYFHRHPHRETVWRRRIAPIVSTVVLTLIAVTSIAFFGDLISSSHPVKVWGAPLVYAAVAVAGIGWALHLRRHRPHVYAVIGHGERTRTTAIPSGVRHQPSVAAEPASASSASR
ncbi:APC family permease [Actinoplanes sp. Pm04-4]|uniref:APC family permease n=1 Tax=Paractinoplanes pyxinae TaxID=2997416 RepID=A0ABT4B7B2_9ACTN|nr:APC family permease [Actinoplanes pyxinae]MCY1141480.1 APC family permease [Actinoplanes pyxinae]